MEKNPTNSQYENERLKKENQTLPDSSSYEDDFQETTLEEIRVLEDIMKQLYKELIKLQKVASSLMAI